jgi:hypothetical protein
MMDFHWLSASEIERIGFEMQLLIGPKLCVLEKNSLVKEMNIRSSRKADLCVRTPHVEYIM